MVPVRTKAPRQMRVLNKMQIAYFNKTLIAIFSMTMGVSFSQVVEKSKTDGISTERSERIDIGKSTSKSRSVAVTYTPGGLFFDIIGKMEALPGSGLGITYDNTDHSRCKIFNGAFVWGNNHGIVIERKYMNGSPGAITNWGEGDVMRVGRTDFIYNTIALDYLNKPIRPHTYLYCANVYKEWISGAVKEMVSGAKRKDGVFYIADLKSAAIASLSASVDRVNLKMHGATDPSVYTKSLGIDALEGTDKSCLIPTASGFLSGKTSFQCNEWFVEQRPLMLYRYNRIILSDDTVDGVKYQFADASDFVESSSNSKSKNKATSSTTSQGQKIKTQRN